MNASSSTATTRTPQMDNISLTEHEQSMQLYRKLIDCLDKDLLSKLHDRLIVADAVANTKFDAGQPIDDPVREAEVIENAVRNFPKSEDYPTPTRRILTDTEIRRFIKTVIAIAKKVEKRVMKHREFERKYKTNRIDKTR